MYVISFWCTLHNNSECTYIFPMFCIDDLVASAPPSLLGVPATLDPAGIICYILNVRNDMDSVGGVTVPHPTTTVMVNLTYPCEEYTATIFARSKQAGNGPPTMETFTLKGTSVFTQNALRCSSKTLN